MTLGDGRDCDGKFVSGNKVASGRRPYRTEREYLRTTLGACSLEHWEVIVKRAVEDAMGGDAKAREWLAKYLLGVPKSFEQSPLMVQAEEIAGLDPVKHAAKTMSVDALLDTI